MKTHLSLKNQQKRELPDEFRDDDVRFTEELVSYFVNRFSEPGDVVFDPFMGFGTTLIVAESMERIGIGVEYDERRVNYVRSIIEHSERAIHGDSRNLQLMPLPEFALSVTSPPYMGRHHSQNPFTAYTTEDGGYPEYLETIRDIYRQVNEKLKSRGRAVIEVSNLKHEDGSMTPLAWDIARAVSSVMKFQGEVIVTWEGGYGYGYDHSYCLIFERS